MKKILYIQNNSSDFIQLLNLTKPLNVNLLRISSNNVLLAHSQLKSINFECVIIDATNCFVTALKILEKLNQTKITQPILTWSHNFNENFYKQAIENGAWDYICKSQLDYKNLIILKNAIAYNNLQKNNTHNIVSSNNFYTF